MRHKLIRMPLALTGLALSAVLVLAACDSGSGGSDAASPERGDGDAAGQSQTGKPAESQASNGTDYTQTVSADSLSEAGHTLGPVSMGDPDAPVTVIEYASLTCPHCARFHADVLPKLKSEYIATGQVRYEFHNFVLNQLDLAASMIIRCQGPDRFFPLLDLLFANQRDWLANAQDRDQVLSSIASVLRRAGVSRADIDSCLAERDLQQHLTEMTQTGQQEWDVNATPTLIVDGEKRGAEAQSFETLSELIEEAL